MSSAASVTSVGSEDSGPTHDIVKDLDDWHSNLEKAHPLCYSGAMLIPCTWWPAQARSFDPAASIADAMKSIIDIIQITVAVSKQNSTFIHKYAGNVYTLRSFMKRRFTQNSNVDCVVSSDFLSAGAPDVFARRNKERLLLSHALAGAFEVNSATAARLSAVVYQTVLSGLGVPSAQLGTAQQMNVEVARALSGEYMIDANAIKTWIDHLSRKRPQKYGVAPIVIESEHPVPSNAKNNRVGNLIFEFGSAGTAASLVKKIGSVFSGVVAQAVGLEAVLASGACRVSSPSQQFNPLPSTDTRTDWDAARAKWKTITKAYLDSITDERIVMAFVLHWNAPLHWTILVVAKVKSDASGVSKFVYRHIDSLGGSGDARHTHVNTQYVPHIRSVFEGLFGQGGFVLDSTNTKNPAYPSIVKAEEQQDGTSCGLFVCSALMSCNENHVDFVTLPNGKSVDDCCSVLPVALSRSQNQRLVISHFRLFMMGHIFGVLD